VLEDGDLIASRIQMLGCPVKADLSNILRLWQKFVEKAQLALLLYRRTKPKPLMVHFAHACQEKDIEAPREFVSRSSRNCRPVQ
jgi:hypothetical protein